MGGPLCGRRCCPCGQTDATAPRAAAPAGAAPIVTSLVGWRHPEGGASMGAAPAGAAYARKRRPYKRQLCPRAIVPGRPSSLHSL
ncbi:hypothetical protein BHM03_00028019 [Ensete ventricosum]|nr:hypothetical protein BHM03_00028019 [Ensete ventricosum]